MKKLNRQDCTRNGSKRGKGSTVRLDGRDTIVLDECMELVFILDTSGSMCGLEADTVGGFNSLIQENREKAGTVNVSTVLFNDRSRVLLDRVDIDHVAPLTERDICCCGCTALLDAVGDAVRHHDLVQRVLPAGYRADKVLFAIMTDGQENASRRYTYQQVKGLIETHREQGWEFLFIGANIDAAAEAESIGIARNRAVDYVADERGTELVFTALQDAVCCMRAPDLELQDDWANQIAQDYRARSRAR